VAGRERSGGLAPSEPPLRASTGFRERHLQEVGSNALRPLGYVAERQKDLPPAQRTC
jgi:hypothetical protein